MGRKIKIEIFTTCPDTNVSIGGERDWLQLLRQVVHPLQQVLSEDKISVKALFRRGKAKSELGQAESAGADFLKAKYSPRDMVKDRNGRPEREE
ncbi:peptidyl-prolyl cis-trans isomerase FKBP42-like [Panicum miliaceum]|uniref:Peptidyl-prolyl cis-trans isomerase FKBP42-like n=1 Tax=Panicum miliaceum TaxID=4540 RepID=A0A3L6T5E2_PANMI|nr:peptidyl-prolyl cis-trans isomerase FKBP42-like [Panicum miliaceum]